MPCLVKHRLNKEEENDLRSHFADGKQPMSVTFEFQLNHQLKVHRQGPYIKEGNTTKTNAKFDVLRWWMASMKLEKVK